MSLTIHGNNTSYQMQPGRVLTHKNDGTIEGLVVYKGPASSLPNWPEVNSRHPDDDRLEMYQASYEFGNNGEAVMTASYFGLAFSPTPQQISYTGGQNNDPIETHPDFEKFAGTPDDPADGAKFDPETKEFLGFYNGDYAGVEYYLTPSTMVSVSYWTDRAPRVSRRMKIQSSIPGFAKPSDVKNFLLLDTPYRQVGNFYQVTEQYLGSGEKGWNKDIY